MTQGRVYLVGAGPGDPGLFTLRGREVLGRAQAVVYDALISPRLLDYAPPGAQRIYVGKRSGQHSMKQEEISRLLVELGLKGLTVVRLKGGDPFLFGRGGEEALAVVEAGIELEVVPGVTAGVAACAYAGIPITHRGLAGCAGFVTGHSADEGPASAPDWASLAAWQGTLCFYMSLSNLRLICGELIGHGLPASTPAAVIHWGTTPHQRVVTGTLETLPAVVEAAKIETPALIVVGKVVSLREKLDWFSRRALAGRKVVVTRPREQSREMIALLEDAGAEVIECPTIRIEPAQDAAALRQAARGARDFDWVLFTSANAVDAFWAALRAEGLDSRALGPAQVGAIGPATAERLAAVGIVPDARPEKFTTAAMVEFLSRDGQLMDKRVLCPRSDIAPRDLIDGLSSAGAIVTEVAAYRTVPDESGAAEVKELLVSRAIAWLTFTSSSTAEFFLRAVGVEAVKHSGARIVSIGPSTSATIRKAGLTVDAEAESATAPGVVSAIIAAEAGRK